MEAPNHLTADLQYEALEHRIANLKFSNSTEKRGKALSRTSIATFGFLLLFLGSKYLPSPYDRWTLVITGIAFIVFGILTIVLAAAQVRREYMRAKALFAADMDSDYVKYQELLEWIRSFSKPSIASRLQFVKSRRDTMAGRVSVISGGIEKLGFLPVLAALYIQFKDYEFTWPLSFPHTITSNLIIGVLIFSAYLGSFFSIRIKLRLDFYERTLQDALELPGDGGDDDDREAPIL